MAKGQFKYLDAGDTVKIGYTNPDNPASVVIQLECKKPANKSTYATSKASDQVKGLQDPPRWQVDVPEADTESYPAVVVTAYAADSLDKASAANKLDTDFVVFNVNKSSGQPVVVVRSADTPDIPEKSKPQLTAAELEKLTPIRQWIVGYIVPRACPATAGETEKDGSMRFDDNVQKKSEIESTWNDEYAEYQRRKAQWKDENGGVDYDTAMANYSADVKAYGPKVQAWIKANPGKAVAKDAPDDIKHPPVQPKSTLKSGVPIKPPHYTTCGAFASYVSSATNTVTSDGKKTGPGAPTTTSGGKVGGLIGTMWAGRDSDGGGWVTARDGVKPKPGDFYMLSGSPKVYPKDAKLRIGANGADDIDALPKDDKKAVQNPKNAIEVMHVGIIVKNDEYDGMKPGTVMTADGGQGGPPTPFAPQSDGTWKPPQATAYSTRAWMKDQNTKTNSGELLSVSPAAMDKGQPDAGARRIAGWVDVDQHQWKNKPMKFADLPDSVQAWLKALGVKTSSLG